MPQSGQSLIDQSLNVLNSERSGSWAGFPILLHPPASTDPLHDHDKDDGEKLDGQHCVRDFRVLQMFKNNPQKVTKMSIVMMD